MWPNLLQPFEFADSSASGTLPLGDHRTRGFLALTQDAQLASDAGEEQEVSLAELPARVRDAANLAVDGAEWETTAYLITDVDGQFYELTGIDRKRRLIVVSITPAGELDEVETEVRVQDLPEGVMDAVRQKLPRFRATVAFEIRDKEEVTGYVLEGRRPRTRRILVVSVSTDGRTVEAEELEADDQAEPNA